MGARYIVGVDLGGTNTVVGTIRTDGDSVQGYIKVPTPADKDADFITKRISELVAVSIEQTREETDGEVDITGIGIGAPGPLNTATGIVVTSPNLGWKDYPLRDKLTELTGFPTELDNDANCAILGEAWKGAAEGALTVVGITIGTGIGGGIVLNGEVYHGASDVAGEFGHMTIDSTGRRCKCGNYGCLEAYASGPAIAARAVESLESEVPSQLPDMVDGDLAKITSETVYEAAGGGDKLALEVVRDTAKFLGAGVANLVNVLNPEVFVICGGVTKAGGELFDPLRDEVRRRAFRPAVDACTIVPGKLPGTAGVYGAVKTLRNRQKKQ